MCETDVNGKKLVIVSENDGQYIFEPACIQPDPTESLLEEMRSVSLVEINNPPVNKGVYVCFFVVVVVVKFFGV